MGTPPARPPSRLRGCGVYGSGGPVLGSWWWLRVLRWGTGVGGHRGYPRDVQRGPGRYLCACSACARGGRDTSLCPCGARGGDPPAGVWGVRWGEVGYLAGGGPRYSAERFGVRDCAIWGAGLGSVGCFSCYGAARRDRGRVGSAGSGASLAPQSSQFNQQGTQLRGSGAGGSLAGGQDAWGPLLPCWGTPMVAQP